MLSELRRAFDNLGVPVEEVGRGRLDRLSGGGSHQGVMVRAGIAGEVGLAEFEELVTERGRLFSCLILDGVQDPRNLGACLRNGRRKPAWMPSSCLAAAPRA